MHCISTFRDQNQWEPTYLHYCYYNYQAMQADNYLQGCRGGDRKLHLLNPGYNIHLFMDRIFQYTCPIVVRHGNDIICLLTDHSS
jgi:hypothetical protein